MLPGGRYRPSVQQSLKAAPIARVFPNVFVDLCWAQIISPSASRRALHEMLDGVPSNKFFGYRGDYRCPELSYTLAKPARRNISQVLTEKVSEGSCSEEEELELGRKLQHDNPDALFGNASSTPLPTGSSAGTRNVMWLPGW